uniref:Uncharacterized protein n=1 Tax=Paracidobacterium acidisoli TaxID=2303751 RepID=A0A372ISJ5_9BACT
MTKGGVFSPMSEKPDMGHPGNFVFWRSRAEAPFLFLPSFTGLKPGASTGSRWRRSGGVFISEQRLSGVDSARQFFILIKG